MPEDRSKAPKTARGRLVRLENVLDTYEAWEKRTLADLRVAGFKFTTIAQAQRYRKAQATLARMEHDELVEFVARSMAMTDDRKASTAA